MLPLFLGRFFQFLLGLLALSDCPSFARLLSLTSSLLLSGHHIPQTQKVAFTPFFGALLCSLYYARKAHRMLSMMHTAQDRFCMIDYEYWSTNIM